MKSNNQTREARSNPEVREKRKNLKANWESLSNSQRRKSIQELTALGCTNTDLGRLLGLTESAIRYYSGKSARGTKSTLTGSADVKPVSAPLEYDDELLQCMIDNLDSLDDLDTPPPLSRKEQIRECSNAFLTKFAGCGRLRSQSLDLVRRRCEQWEYCGSLPKPVAEDVAPATVFAEFSAAGLDLEPGDAVEFLAVSLLRLVPDSYQREQLLRELEANG